MRIAVIGGGASGLMAAITAARNNAVVTVYERCDRVGRKILATGNGRCNYTNIYADVENYHGENPDFIKASKNRFWVEEAKAFFAELGMLTKVEEKGKAYPYSLQASAVLDVLRYEVERLGILVVTDFEVSKVIKEKDGFLLKAYNGQTANADRVILASGGKASPSLGSNGSGYQIAKAFGHKTTKKFPSLVQVKTETQLVKALKGIKTDALVTFRKDNFTQKSYGEVLFCDYGLSGPAIFNLSRLCTEYENGELILDLLPEIEYQQLRELLRKRRSPQRNLESFFVGMVNKKLGMTVMKYAGVLPYSRTADTISDKEIDLLCNALKKFTLMVTGTMSWNNAQVTAGGIRTCDVDEATLESKLCKGLYFAGEILDIDGDCGGYNLQWAWTSGYVAGINAAEEKNA